MNYGSINPQQLMAQMMQGFNEAGTGGGGPKLLDGNHYLKILEAKNGVAPSQGVPFFVASFEVLQSDNPQHKAGDHVEWMVWFDNPQYLPTYQADVKQFLLAAFAGFDPSVTVEQITDQAWAAAVSQNQPLVGRFIRAHGFRKDKKKAAGDFLKINYIPWAGPEQDPMPAQQQAFAPPAQQQAFAPPAQQQAFALPAQQQAFTPPAQQQAFAPPAQQQAFTPPAQQQTFTPPAQQQTVPSLPGGNPQQPNNGWGAAAPSGPLPGLS